MKIDTNRIARMSLDELLEIETYLHGAIRRRREIERAAVLQEIRELLDAHGLRLQDILAPRRERKRSARWRDPVTGVVWAGTGRMPEGFDKSRAIQL